MSLAVEEAFAPTEYLASDRNGIRSKERGEGEIGYYYTRERIASFRSQVSRLSNYLFEADSSQCLQ